MKYLTRFSREFAKGLRADRESFRSQRGGGIYRFSEDVEAPSVARTDFAAGGRAEMRFHYESCMHFTAFEKGLGFFLKLYQSFDSAVGVLRLEYDESGVAYEFDYPAVALADNLVREFVKIRKQSEQFKPGMGICDFDEVGQIEKRN